ncbi:MAG: hypothetical protein IKD20_02995 [Clostridia bacterium]|nr:hypothetical protein [Clostridia bacterium]
MKNKFIVALLSLVLMLGVSVGALAVAPSGYETVTTSEFGGSVVGYDTTTRGFWLSPDGLYSGGDMLANRVYGGEAFFLPMAQQTYLNTVNKADKVSRPSGVNYADYSTWPLSYTYNFAGEDDLVQFQSYSYSVCSRLGESYSGTGVGLSTTADVFLQVPGFWQGSSDTYAATSAFLEGDWGTVVEFNINDDEWHLFSIYLSGARESYRVAIINDTFSSNPKYWNIRNGYNTLYESYLINDITSGKIQVDSYIDLNDYVAETGIYVTFKVKGDFTLIGGCLPDYSRQMLSGQNAKVHGFFFDEFIEDEDNEVISAMHTKLDSREVSLQWDSSELNYNTTILRKEAGAPDSTWTPIAVLPKGIVSYVDKTADAGVSYNYAYASSQGGRYTYPRVIDKTYDTAVDYVDTVLSFSATSTVTDKTFSTQIGKTISVNTYLKQADGTPIVGEDVYLRLEGKYIGGMITDVVYTAKTDSTGKALFRIPCNYANQIDANGYNHYTMMVYTEYNDTLKYKPSALTTTLTVKHKDINKNLQTPYILELSDSVKGGDILNITGSYLYQDTGISFYATPSSATPTFDESVATLLSDVIQYDPLGRFANVRLPEDMSGIYDIWAVNASGAVSMAHRDTKLNVARIYWISEDSAFAGITIKAVGTNFLTSYFGAEGETLVRLTNDKGDNYMMPIVSVNNYCVEFEVTDIPLGEYDVSISTDGESWSNYPEGQTLTIVPKGVGDPLGLGVAWANKFNYTDYFNVVDYGATPNDTTDDTNAFWIAIRQAQLNGGGVVYVPRGTFYVSNITMQNGIILMGESRKESVLAYCGPRDGNMITTDTECTGLIGIYNLHITVADEVIIPDQFLQLGDQWGTATKNQNLRTSRYIFVKDIDCFSSILPIVDDDRSGNSKKIRGIFAIVIMDDHFLMDGVDVYGVMGNLNRCYVNEYMSCTNNHFEFVYDTVVSTASYSIVENNDVIGRTEFYSLDANGFAGLAEQNHGIFHRDRTYIAGNTVKNVGQEATDGEVICAEPIGAGYAYGMILSTGISNLYPNNAGIEGYEGRRYMDIGTDWGSIVDISYGVYGKLGILITSGTGIGQFRHVDRNILDGENGNRIYLADFERDWDIVPDSTSTYYLMASIQHVIVYNNYAYDATKGILLYGNYYDSIIAENYNENTEGICVWSAEIVDTDRFNPNFRITIRDNVVKGRSKCGYVGIGTSLNFTVYAETNQNTANFHVEMRNNYIYGDYDNAWDSNNNIVYRKYSTRSEAPDLDGFYVFVYRNSSPFYLSIYPDKTANILLANNHVENTLGGVYIGDYLINGVLVDNTTYVDVKYKHSYEDYYAPIVAFDPLDTIKATIKNVIYSNERYFSTRDDYDNAVASGDILDKVAPIWGNSDIALAPLGNQTYIWWTEAYDNIGVKEYRVYLDGKYYTTTATPYLLAPVKATKVDVYAVDNAGLVTSAPISTGDSLIVNGKTSVGSIAKSINNSFDYTLQVALKKNVDNITFVLDYDPNVLVYKSATLRVKGNMSITTATGRIIGSVSLGEGYSGIEDIINLSFDIKNAESLPEGTTVDLYLKEVKVKAGEYEYDTSLVANGVRYLNVISKVAALDFTGDGLINTNDYNHVLKYLGVKSTDSAWTVASVCDINGDGIIDINDLMTIYYNMQKYD